MGSTRDTLKRRVRKTVKWGGAGLTVLLVVVWIGSGWESLYWENMGGGWLSVGRGQVMFSTPLLGDPATHDGYFVVQREEYGFQWWFFGGKHAKGINLAIPLWLPALLSLLATSAAWRADAKCNRRARGGVCAGCGYDRAGLAAGAVCPECGAHTAASGGA